jgi:parallel beta-helix repeat protein
VKRALTAFLVIAGVVAVLGARPAVPATTSTTLYVAPGATGSGGSCAAASYGTIRAAIVAARSGDTVVVCAGTYKEEVHLSKAITLEGQGEPVVDATGLDSAVLVTASNATVRGLTVTNSTGEGVFLRSVQNVRVEDDVVTHNDLGVGTNAYAECDPPNGTPDCGEGIHLSAVSKSRITGNTVQGNSGGILVSDDDGPTHDNVIDANMVSDNTENCGITVVSHRKGAVDAKGTLHPKVAGVYDNTISNNTVTRSGINGEGAGVLLAAPSAGMAVYDNTVTGNTLHDNGLAGVQVNENAANQYLGGNVVTKNTIGVNNVIGDSPAGDTSTTGLIVFVIKGGRAVRITVTGNAFSNSVYGIFALKGTVLRQSGNTFTGVQTPVHVST